MLKNNLKIAFRSITKHKFFSLIKIISLAIGLSASFVIGLMVYYDLSFDKFHPNGQNIHRITTEFTTPEGKFYNPGVSVALGIDLKEGMPGIETVAPVFVTYPLHVRNMETEKLFKKPEFVIYADQGYFDLFEYEWLVGSTDKILENPNELVLSENRAVAIGRLWITNIGDGNLLKMKPMVLVQNHINTPTPTASLGVVVTLMVLALAIRVILMMHQLHCTTRTLVI